MKILHTADWHLGKKLEHFSRFEEQKAVLQEIVGIVEQEAVDVVIIAGDIFDSFNPPIEATELLYSTLKKISNNGKRLIVAIAGNHDSPDRIDAPDSLAQELGIFFIGYPNAILSNRSFDSGIAIINSAPGFVEFQLPQYNYPLRCLFTPYANEQRLGIFLGDEDKDKNMNQLLQQHWQNVASTYCDTQGVNILVSHLFMLPKSGAIQEESEGERSIRVGNATNINLQSIPRQIQYTALGHLHNFQNINTEAHPVVYSSSPLCYSFAETGQTKKVVIITLEPNETAIFKTIDLIAGRKLHRKQFEHIDEAITWLEQNKDVLVELTIVSDTFIKNSDMKALYSANDGIIHIIPNLKNDILNSNKATHNIQMSLPIQDLFKQYFLSEKKQLPNEEMIALFNEIINVHPENEDKS